MDNKELVSKIKFALIEKYTVKILQPMEEVINDTIEKTLEAINYNSCCVTQPIREEKTLESNSDGMVALNFEFRQLPKCKHKNIIREDGLDECLDCGVRNY